jgi:hypothetical protein
MRVRWLTLLRAIMLTLAAPAHAQGTLSQAADALRDSPVCGDF